MTFEKTFTTEYLDSLRQAGDPAADAVIASLFAEGVEAVHEASRLLRGLVDNDDIPDSSMSPQLCAFLQQTTAPSWADPTRIDIGERIFQRYGPYMITLLNVYALPITYTAAMGVKVLSRTNRLQSNSLRRITETAQMIVDVMSPGGLALDANSYGAGIRSAQKVRLLHATIRYLIQHHDPTWRPEWGIPINQEDMAGTLLSFSVLILDGFAKLGLELTDEEQGAYLHCWNVIGHFMGVRADLVMHKLEDAKKLAQAIFDRQAGPSAEGQALAAALLDMLEHLVPGNVLDGVPARLMRFFIGEEAAQHLALPAQPPLRDHLGIGRFFAHLDEELKDHVGLARRSSELLGRALLQGLLMVFRGPKRQPFDLPSELRQQWGINWKPLA